jgi:hypothetical protein
VTSPRESSRTCVGVPAQPFATHAKCEANRFAWWLFQIACVRFDGAEKRGSLMLERGRVRAVFCRREGAVARDARDVAPANDDQSLPAVFSGRRLPERLALENNGGLPLCPGGMAAIVPDTDHGMPW